MKKVYLIVEIIDLGYRVLHATLDSETAKKLLEQERNTVYCRQTYVGSSETMAIEIANNEIKLEEIVLS